MIGGVEAVFHKIRGNSHYFVAGFRDGTEKGVHGTCRAAGDETVVCSYVNSLFLLHQIGNDLASPWKTAIGHIPESKRFLR